MRRNQTTETALILLILLPILAGCNAPIFDRTTQDVQEPGAKIAASPTPHAAPPEESPFPDSPAPGACPVHPSTPNLPALDSLQDPGLALLTFLNQGGSIGRLRAALDDAGVLPDDGLALVQADFTGDELLDVAMGLAPTSLGDGRAGLLLFYPCQGDQYLLETVPGPSTEGMPAMIQSADDLNGDGIQDLLVTWRRCGAHTCSLLMAALTWRADHLENRLEGTSEDLPSPTLELLDTGPSNATKIEITSHGVASAGAGPPRLVTRTWVWDSTEKTFKPEPDVQHPSNFRIHVLHDADSASQAGDYTAALSGYQRVIKQESLEDWGDVAQARATLRSFATFRRIHTSLILGDHESAAQAMEALRREHPQGTPGFVYANLADLLWDVFQATGDVDQSCREVQAQASIDPERYLEPLYYGYANPTYEIEQLCPLTKG
jgi:hypothetical protein